MPSASRLEKAIDAAVLEHVPEDGPGAAVLVLSGGRVVHQKGYGLADLGGAPVTPHSVFDLASVSKHVTGSAIALLMQEGKIAPDDPVKKHIRNFRMEPDGRDVTIHDLLWHVSALPDYTGDAWEGTDEEFAELTNEGLVDWLNELEPDGPPGVEYEYNNTGYALLARVVEVVSRTSYARFVGERLFAPLGMTRTVALDDLSRSLPGRVTGYISKKGKTQKSESPSVIQGDGNVFSCIHDLALWDLAMRNHTLLTRETLEQAWSAGTFDDGSEIDAEGSGYGYGWCVDAEGDYPSIFHGGSWSGTATNYVRYLDDDQSYVVLSNDEERDVEALSEAVEAAVSEEDE